MGWLHCKSGVFFTLFAIANMHLESEVRYFARINLTKERVEDLAVLIEELPCKSLEIVMSEGGDYDCDSSYWDDKESCFWWAPKLPTSPQIGWTLIITVSDPLGFVFLDVKSVTLLEDNMLIA